MDDRAIFTGDYANRDFFTTDQVAQILEMTPRTVRNFIKSKKIRAAKFGGEWRISKTDLIQFMEMHFNAQSVDGRYEKMNNEVRDFISGDHMEIEGSLQICTIVDHYEENESLAMQKRDQIWNIVNTESEGSFRGEWHYEKNEKKARFVFWSDSPRFISKLLGPLKNN